MLAHSRASTNCSAEVCSAYFENNSTQPKTLLILFCKMGYEVLRRLNVNCDGVAQKLW